MNYERSAVAVMSFFIFLYKSLIISYLKSENIAIHNKKSLLAFQQIGFLLYVLSKTIL